MKDILYRGNTNQVEHLLRKRLGPTASASYVQFEAGLRDDLQKDKKLVELERKWNNIPFKDRKEFPKFLPKLKDELQMRKTAKLSGEKINLYHDGFDRYLALPKFNQKLKEKNIAANIHLLTPDAFTSTVQWETSLRS
ncbi:hypothetical protein IMG5_092190 [Ichthyophthirius multifiliis]|uniref:Uncharacterized protein n=1 Tax=Ichthyophthirius multifiliis TaxID=5932 RepID=G0QRE5_ICHMU|nr:hypothetical protein IMG5_092190 [Ichthyophthirius multifiliis]EGR32214.1 hypothetical protein IMG5_092190 [Ichthyophthirius multifiliis]|eukprot:XP_004035700.1 hypothetical protein IMG5_092190 [Ichthyophthirius multifiliis]